MRIVKIKHASLGHHASKLIFIHRFGKQRQTRVSTAFRKRGTPERLSLGDYAICKIDHLCLLIPRGETLLQCYIATCECTVIVEKTLAVRSHGEGGGGFISRRYRRGMALDISVVLPVVLSSRKCSSCLVQKIGDPLVRLRVFKNAISRWISYASTVSRGESLLSLSLSSFSHIHTIANT